MGASSDLFIVRLMRWNGELRLQTRIGTTNTTIYDFNAQTLPDTLTIRAEVDLDADLLDLYYEIGTGGESVIPGIAINDGEMDGVRMIGVLNTTDFGATDFVDIDYVTLAQIPEPATLGLLGLISSGIYFARRFFIA